MLTLQMPAKVNLSLDVVGRRDDGYHLLRMLMQTVSLYDTIRVAPGNPGETEIRFSSNVRFLPTDRRNLAVAAALRFFEQLGQTPAAEIQLTKRIPVAAGLAGGSTDAAGVLLALNRLHGDPFTPAALAKLALPLGADIPYCLQGGSALAEGVGERLTKLPPLPDCRILLCKPPVSVSTAAIFSRLQYRKLACHPDTPGLTEALEAGSLPGVARRLYNVLEPITTTLCPAVEEIRRAMLDRGALGAVMSGSGPTVLGVFADEAAAAPAYAFLQPLYADTYLTRPVDGPLWERD